jgi:hypothetical protein
MKGKLFEVTLKLVQRHIEERGLPNVSQFGFRARHSTALQCTRPTLISTICLWQRIFLDIEKAFDTTWHIGLLHKLSKLEFSTSLIKDKIPQRFGDWICHCD